jgi:hypothetical protein
MPGCPNTRSVTGSSLSRRTSRPRPSPSLSPTRTSRAPRHLPVHGQLRGTGRNGRLLGRSRPGHQVPLRPRPVDQRRDYNVRNCARPHRLRRMALTCLPAVRGVWPRPNRKPSGAASGCFPTVARSGRIFSGSSSHARSGHVRPACSTCPSSSCPNGRACSHAPVSGAELPDTSPVNAPSPLMFGVQTFSTRSFVNSETTSSMSCLPVSPPPPRFRPSQWTEMRRTRRVFPIQPSE